MRFTIWHYIIPTFGVFVLTFLICVAICVVYYFVKPKAKRNLSVAVVIPSLASLTMILSFIYAFSSVGQWAYLLDTSAWAVTNGVVEDVRMARKTPVYLDWEHKNLCTPSLITIAGTDYYILTSTGISEGDHLVIKYCTDGNTVLEWSKDLSQLGNYIKDIVSQENIVDFSAFNKTDIISVRQIVIVGVFIFIMLFVLDGPIGKKRLEYLKTNEIETDGLVCPRKISAASCTLEFIVSFFAILSLFSESITLIVPLVTWTICIWGIRFAVQQTFVMYNGNSFTYLTVGVSKTYSILDVQTVDFIPTRFRGCMLLRVHLRNGSILRFEHINFNGLKLFYQWLNSGIMRD